VEPFRQHIFVLAIRLSEHEMVGIQRVAATKGIPYQTLISELIHQFVEGDPIQKI
jgi:predicted DNA binding CopG/RHH family protein